ncbi:hypothetical protein RND71_036847 [Anisodus tanguticus]|uniref:Uncharacterized protein n=1 Tax=Anisodus tanguticus TaxID=243964 RepID=A0AAE1R276_9SOLA|nr:hypothetical protein RND71_036847 [Anisodus tanguticus]
MDTRPRPKKGKVNSRRKGMDTRPHRKKDKLTSCGVSVEDLSLEVSSSLFTEVFLDPERSSRARVFLIFSATLLPSFDALVEDLIPFEDEDPKLGFDAEDPWSACCPSMLSLLLVIGPKLSKVTPMMLSTSAENLELAALEEIDLELIFF